MEKKFSDIPREEIKWFPSINYEFCDSCNVCIDFCPKGVYERDDYKIIKVKNPYNCTVGCNMCEQICPKKAINFPSLDVIMQAKQKWGVK